MFTGSGLLLKQVRLVSILSETVEKWSCFANPNNPAARDSPPRIAQPFIASHPCGGFAQVTASSFTLRKAWLVLQSRPTAYVPEIQCRNSFYPRVDSLHHLSIHKSVRRTHFSPAFTSRPSCYSMAVSPSSLSQLPTSVHLNLPIGSLRHVYAEAECLFPVIQLFLLTAISDH